MNLKNKITDRSSDYRMLHTDPNFHTVMLENFLSLLPQSPHEYIVVSIGTDRSTGDALGPLAGSLLSEKKPRHMSVYGTLDNPVHAVNLTEYIHQIEATYRHPFIIAIDACLGKQHSVGKVIAGTGAIKPGAALNKALPAIGDVHLTGVVNVSGFMEYSVLQNTRLQIVMAMAKSIANLLDAVDQRLTYRKRMPAAVITKHIQSNLM
ncbi:hypothetical protein J32TS6_35840 [Virgibacillus pantothenticus]|jgi:putative sporulation protein YyaC|uniref:spore protease YyaC n=1 Tax=Virgibacillus TaxID=84406 RepID=UPI000909EA26|nr:MULTISPECIES: spore protease YyaC [Virgibacillus]API92210.1 spore protease YyaC [Virgibacillus sp. 6R]MBS7427193.1 spore protease YyaC [Virgibacillus sp. 19R1-5]MBU8567449.1 spore protease YyaC [Virgibacillus pantothenticus]MBU8601189.1 spore protease YyaC [Virgibacillus pantothenticus]MBU8635539.1 spore protease YyaC [Virgibacillus pantothenticus]